MTRADYDDIEAVAIAALIGALSCGGAGSPNEVAKTAFEYAEALVAERKARMGEKPPYDH